ncbi:hypothetical protein FRC10_007942 [Ceratobasidium sp. 414]|nr:hypothetical protein FRC10_007942 [Ceratobasidium sp. 414]
MSATAFSVLANDNLPSPDAIVAMCTKAGFERTGIPLHDQSSGHIVAWVKYGPNVHMYEAATQHWVAQNLDANPEATVRVPLVYNAFSISTTEWPIGFIVMEYIDAPDCTKEDVKLVAQAVQMLISIRGPTSAPGHVDGGPVVHTFFVDDWTSPFIYKTVDELGRHVNGILRYKGDTRRVNLVADARAGLRLCPCDINPGNFKKPPAGKVVALDFRATCFLPPSFFAVTMEQTWDVFTQRVAMHIDYPKPKDLAAMVSASFYLVPYGSSDIGQPDNFSFYLD